MAKPHVLESDRALIAFMLSASIASTIGGLPFDSLPAAGWGCMALA